MLPPPPPPPPIPVGQRTNVIHPIKSLPLPPRLPSLPIEDKKYVYDLLFQA